MGKAKIIFGDHVLQDLTNDTVTPEVLMEGYTAHAANGEMIVGTANGGTNDYEQLTNQPQINNVTLIGNKSLSDLGAVSKDEAREYELIEGKNKLKNEWESGSESGITWMVYSDGTVLVDGTATAIVNISIPKPDIPDGVDLVLSGCPSGGSSSTYFLMYTNMVDRSYKDVGDGITIRKFDYTQKPNSALRIVVMDGTQVDNMLVSPMICTPEDWAVSHTYEPYYRTISDRVQTIEGKIPSTASSSNKMATASDITDVYEIMGENGAVNICPFNPYIGTNGGITATSSGDTLILNNSATTVRWFGISEPITNQVTGTLLLKAGTYKLSSPQSSNFSGRKYLAVVDNNGNILASVGGDTSSTFTLAIDTLVCVAVRISANTSLSDFRVQAMLYDARITATKYQPYAMTNRELTDAVVVVEDITSQLQVNTSLTAYEVVSGYTHCTRYGNLITFMCQLKSLTEDAAPAGRAFQKIFSNLPKPLYNILISTNSSGAGSNICESYMLHDVVSNMNPRELCSRGGTIGQYYTIYMVYLTED